MTQLSEGAVNGAAPAPGPDEGAGGASLSERLLGVFGIAFAGVLLGIGLDMLTGGRIGLAALLNAVAARQGGEDAG